MATPYEKVYDRFLNRITDFNLGDLDDYTLNEIREKYGSTSYQKSKKLEIGAKAS